jgi:OOP family OmpA-OmpF porin
MPRRQRPLRRQPARRLLALAALPATLAAALVIGPAAGAQDAPAYSRQFREYLSQRYELLARDEASSADILDPYYFTRQAAHARAGEIAPLPLDNVRFVGSSPETLGAHRNALVASLNHGAAESHPMLMADALVNYDCWVVHQQSEPYADHNLARCKHRYMRDARELASLYGGTATAQASEENRALAEVFFAYDSANLNATEQAKLDRLRAALARNALTHVVIVGHTDTAGSDAYNIDLSNRRAQTVAAYLNLPADRFEIRERGVGERRLKVQTADNVPLAANRFVRIMARDTGDQASR